jgi:DNA invertase Pin-like site-specific DNA recombinase
VSTSGQTTEAQKHAILSEGFSVDDWYQEEGVSGSIPAKQRPEFARMMSNAKKGDTCLVTHIDRLGRDAEDILNTINTFKKTGIKLRVTMLDSVDVTSPTGKLLVTMLSGLAEMEKAILVERTINGIANARKDGVKWGAPLKTSPDRMAQIFKDKKEGMTLNELSEKWGIHRNTLQKQIAKWYGNLEGYAEEFTTKQEQHYQKVGRLVR